MYQDFEVALGASKVVREMLRLQPDETCVITVDTEGDFGVARAIAQAAYAVGGRPLVALTATPTASGKAGEAFWPVQPLAAMLKTTDTWVELNRMGIFYSTPYDEAFAENEKIRHLCFIGMRAALLTRAIARSDFAILGPFLERVAQMTQTAKRIRITTPAGTDVEFANHPEHPFNVETGDASHRGSHMIPGQIGWAPDFETINGTIVFDGSVSKLPGVGVLNEPIVLRIEKAEIIKVEGGREASAYDSWLRHWQHPQMLRLAHVCYGLLPNAELTGVIAEDERIWGSTQWGIGNVGPTAVPGGIAAPSHSDGICLNSSVWLDDEKILEEGTIVHSSLVDMAKQLRS